MSKSPDKLFKFCTTDTALQILTTSSLRWSSPVVFSDPLELNYNTPINFDREVLLQSAIKLATAMIFAADPPRGNTPLINAIVRWREEERFSTPEEAEGVLKELLTKMVNHRIESVNQIHKAWQEYNRTTRICCFVNRPDNVAAWDRFGENHQGICFRFESSKDSSINSPRQVLYKSERPELADLREQIDSILFNLPQKKSPNFEELLSIKPQLRRQEQEWRCFKPSPNKSICKDNRTWIDDIPFNREELSAVCFGIATPPEIKKEVIKILRERFPATRHYQTSLANGRYELEIQKSG